MLPFWNNHSIENISLSMCFKAKLHCSYWLNILYVFFHFKCPLFERHSILPCCKQCMSCWQQLVCLIHFILCFLRQELETCMAIIHFSSSENVYGIRF
jgi:hypothetical protein